MKELGLNTAELDAVADNLAKYSPDQSRVPAGSGAESGRWTDGNFGLDPPNDPARISRLRLDLIQVAAADGPIQPDGYQTTFTTDNALDPQGLNTPPTPEEQSAAANTLNTIVSGNMAAILALEPHPYDNRPHKRTGAVLPPTVGGYVAFDIQLGARGRGNGRLIIDKGNLRMFYTTTHYLSFYNYNVRVKR